MGNGIVWNPKELPSERNDLRTQQEMIREYVLIHGQVVLWERQALRNSDLLDTLHNEVLDSARTFEAPVAVKTLLQIDPPQQLLTKWGIDESRDLVLNPAVITLVEAGLARFSVETDPTSRPVFDVAVGDRLTWDDTRYEVLEVVRSRYWGNTNLPLYLRVTANRWREDASEFDCDDIGNSRRTFGGEGSIVKDDC